jgi:predicted ATP-dependent endonuclease of OLD family
MISPLKTVTIGNFRGIRALTLELHPRVNVFFGANGAGKTSLIDAIAIGLGPIVSITPKAKGRSFGRDDLRRPWADAPDHSEQRNRECQYTKIEIVAADGLRWDVHRLRSTQDKAALPPTVGQKELRAKLACEP